MWHRLSLQRDAERAFYENLETILIIVCTLFDINRQKNYTALMQFAYEFCVSYQTVCYKYSIVSA